MYDAFVIGGGIAGLAFAIDLNSRGYSVMVAEKGDYPRHKVCGEYISMESYNYLLKICPSINKINIPIIKNFQLSSTSENIFTTQLKSGGFGISRYLLEQLLYEEAIAKGVKVITKTRIKNYFALKNNHGFDIEAGNEKITAKILVNASGKYSKTEGDKKIKGTNYVGVKYHVRIERNAELIELHNFPGGYCGISNIEDGKACLCYMINAGQLVKGPGSLKETEKLVLWQNKHLKKIFNDSEFIFEEPVTTSGINFVSRQKHSNNVFYLGDAAGSIAPLTGNGMSMGLRGASMLVALCHDYFSGQISKEDLKKLYSIQWKKEFEMRIKLSRYFQKLSEYPVLSKMTIGIFNALPALANKAIGQTHGLPF